jgi:hypothetical protein
MATSTAISAGVLEPVNELIAKLVGGNEEALAAVLKQEGKLRSLAVDLNLDNSELLGQILDYQKKFQTLPTWADLEDYMFSQPGVNAKNTGRMFQLEDVKKLVDEGFDPIFGSLDVLIDKVAEDVKNAKFLRTLHNAKSIMLGNTKWVDPGLPLHERKQLEDMKGADAATAWLASQIDLPDNDSYETEPGEETLVQGRDACATFILTAISADSITAEAISWLWPERFPLAKMSLISGKPDNGKSQVTLDIIARTTTGSDWPDGSKNTLGPRDVLMAVAEDDLADTVIPRLKSAGADLKRIKIINRVRTQEFDEKGGGKKSEVRRLQLSEDIKKLKMAIEANPQIALVVVDTLTSYFGDVNANADQDIRPVMDALAKAFGDCGACFLGVIHHNKKSDVDALQAILGASSVAGAVRSAWSCSKDPDNEGEFYFTLVKGNLTKKRSGMKYRTAEKTIDGLTAPYIEWAGETNEDANSVMAMVKEARNEKKHGVDKARLFIPMALEHGPVAARELYAKAEAEGVSSDQMRRAKDELGVKVTKQKDGWYWSLPVNEKSFLLEDVAVL